MYGEYRADNVVLARALSPRALFAEFGICPTTQERCPRLVALTEGRGAELLSHGYE